MLATTRQLCFSHCSSGSEHPLEESCAAWAVAAAPSPRPQHPALMTGERGWEMGGMASVTGASSSLPSLVQARVQSPNT